MSDEAESPTGSTPSTAGDWDERGFRLLDDQPVSAVHSELFHYTNLTALGRILKSNQLWASSAFHLNDTSEMRLFWQHLELPVRGAFETAITELVEARPDLAPRFTQQGGIAHVAVLEARNWLGAARQNLFADDGEGGVAHPFVVSFTTHSGVGDTEEYRRRHGMLSQWRGYAAGDGVAVVFNSRALEGLIALEERQYRYWPLLLADAVYDGVVRRFEMLFAEICGVAPLLINRRDKEAHELFVRVSDRLAAAVTRVKHPAFQEEGECRIVAGATPVRLHRDLKEADDRGRQPFKSIHYRRGPNGSVPYIKLFEDLTERLPITRIIVGPSRHQLAVLEEARALMLKHGYDPDDVQLSEIPYVGSA